MEIGDEIGNLIIHKLQRFQNSPITIFIPTESLAHTNKLPEWLPNPIIGIFSRETLTLIAKANIDINDINGIKIKCKQQDSKLLINNCELISEPTFFMHTKSIIALYKTKHVNTKPTTSSIQTPSIQDKQKQLTTNEYNEPTKKELQTFTKFDERSKSPSNYSETTEKSKASTRSHKSRQSLTGNRRSYNKIDNDGFETKTDLQKGKVKNAEIKLLQLEARR